MSSNGSRQSRKRKALEAIVQELQRCSRYAYSTTRAGGSDACREALRQAWAAAPTRVLHTTSPEYQQYESLSHRHLVHPRGDLMGWCHASRNPKVLPQGVLVSFMLTTLRTFRYDVNLYVTGSGMQSSTS